MPQEPEKYYVCWQEDNYLIKFDKVDGHFFGSSPHGGDSLDTFVFFLLEWLEIHGEGDIYNHNLSDEEWHQLQESIKILKD